MTPLLHNTLRRYATRQVTAEQLQDWLFDYAFRREEASPQDRDAIGLVESALAEFTGGHIDETELRRAVVELLADTVLIRFGDSTRQQVVGSSQTTARAVHVEVHA